MIYRRRLVLMRHGMVAYFDGSGRPLPSDDVPLTPVGKQQAQRAGGLLAGAGIRLDRVVTSSRRRTHETAALVLDAGGFTGIPTYAVTALDEIRGGKLASIPDDQLAAAFIEALEGGADAHWRARRFLNGEALGEFLDRVTPAVTTLLADPSWDTALWVLHGGVNRAILSYFLGGPGTFIGRLAQDAGCINVIDVGATLDRSVVRVVNHCPLDPLQRETRATSMEALLAEYRRHRPASGAEDAA